MNEKFERLERLIGSESFAQLQNKTVLVLGLGGVGGYVVEALVRSGIGHLILVDFDRIELSNLNRQIIALRSTIGQRKVDVMAERILAINENCLVTKVDEFIDSDNLDKLFSFNPDFLVDACDTVKTKIALMEKCLEKKKQFLSCLGTGNKFDPSLLEITVLTKTVNDPLARVLRKAMKDRGIKEKIWVLSSRELPIKLKNRTPGSTAFVPSAAGLLIASYVVQKFLEASNKKEN